VEVDGKNGLAALAPAEDVTPDNDDLVPHRDGSPGSVEVIGEVVLPVVPLLYTVDVGQRHRPDGKRAAQGCGLAQEAVEDPRAGRFAGVLPRDEVEPRFAATQLAVVA